MVLAAFEAGEGADMPFGFDRERLEGLRDV